jgi:superfamily II DNA/RNA helicase
MLDMGFAPQLKQIFRYLPENFQTLLFSATMPQNIVELSENILKNPVKIEANPVSTAAPKINQQMKVVDGNLKNDAVLDEINQRRGSILIFTRTQRRTDRLAKYLESYAVPVGRIHGGRTQGQRNRAIDEFRQEKTRILVATDIAARGIDIDHVEHVINYDLPQVAEDYVHRIGRTGRAGREGAAISFVSHEERPLWNAIQKLIRPSEPLPFANSTKTIEKPRSNQPSMKRRKFKPRRAPR